MMKHEQYFSTETGSKFDKALQQTTLYGLLKILNAVVPFRSINYLWLNHTRRNIYTRQELPAFSGDSYISNN